jgi:hypothetical protein
MGESELSTHEGGIAMSIVRKKPKQTGAILVVAVLGVVLGFFISSLFSLAALLTIIILVLVTPKEAKT